MNEKCIKTNCKKKVEGESRRGGKKGNATARKGKNIKPSIKAVLSGD